MAGEHGQVLKLPYALTASGQLVRAATAIRGEEYFCTSGSEEVTLRAGDVRVRHFAHRPDHACTSETIAHRTGKLLIAQTVTRYIDGVGEAPRITRSCYRCGRTTEQKVPDKIDEAVVEKRLDDSRLIPDVTLRVAGRAACGVEVLVTHSVDADKRSAYTIPFLEVRAEDIIDDPLLWRPTQDTLLAVHCKRTDCL